MTLMNQHYLLAMGKKLLREKNMTCDMKKFSQSERDTQLSKDSRLPRTLFAFRLKTGIKYDESVMSLT